MYKKLIIIIWITIGALYTISQANIILKFSDIDIAAFEDRFSLVHFTAPGNNFPWSIFRLPSISVNQTVKLWAHQKTCTKQLRGLYFNSQRGKRIRPLDQQTLWLLRNQHSSYNNLEISWGLYTTCDSGNNYGIFWAITYVRRGQTGYVVAGTKLDYTNNKILPSMANSFQYFDNKVPIGYLYDSDGGIGFVGGILSGHENLIEYLNEWWTINNWFTYSGNDIVTNNTWRATTITSNQNAIETMRNIMIQGSVWLSKSMEEKERISFLGNMNEKTIIYNGSNINSSTVINFAKQKAQELCQGKEKNKALADTDTIACYENTNLHIDIWLTNYTNKTIIVKSGNVILEGGMQINSPSLDLFIDKWLLYLPEPITAIDFNDNGFPTSQWSNSWLYIKWNFIINGLIVGNWWAPFNHKLHLQGKIIMLNTPTLPTQARIDQVEGLLWTNIDTWRINLQNIFTRKCGLWGTGSDGSSCINNNIISTIPLVIVNGNYPSNLLQ